MNIEKIWTVSFSPTRTSKKSIEALASGITGIPRETIDLTYPGATPRHRFGPHELVIIGVPVYAGRVAPLAVKRLAAITGDGTPAVIAVTYGNRAYEDALVELRDIARQASLLPVAACAFIGEHSYSSPATPIAPGRPDNEDLTTAASFGARIAPKLEPLASVDATTCPQIPGAIPYKDGVGLLPCPALHEDACTRCAVCLDACPTGAISLETSISIDKERCILCCACVKSCPEDALFIAAQPLNDKRRALSEQLVERKEPELFL